MISSQIALRLDSYYKHNLSNFFMWTWSSYINLLCCELLA